MFMSAGPVTAFDCKQHDWCLITCPSVFSYHELSYTSQLSHFRYTKRFVSDMNDNNIKNFQPHQTEMFSVLRTSGFTCLPTDRYAGRSKWRRHLPAKAL